MKTRILPALPLSVLLAASSVIMPACASGGDEVERVISPDDTTAAPASGEISLSDDSDSTENEVAVGSPSSGEINLYDDDDSSEVELTGGDHIYIDTAVTEKAGLRLDFTLTSLPDKTAYYVGEAASPSLAGAKAEDNAVLTYADGHTAWFDSFTQDIEANVKSGKYEMNTDFDGSKPGTYTVNITKRLTLEGYSAAKTISFRVTVYQGSVTAVTEAIISPASDRQSSGSDTNPRTGTGLAGLALLPAAMTGAALTFKGKTGGKK